MSLEPVLFQTDPPFTSRQCCSTSPWRTQTSNVSNKQVLSAQYNTMPAPGLSNATHQTPTNALYTTFVSHHHCYESLLHIDPHCVNMPSYELVVHKPTSIMTARYPMVNTDLKSPSSGITTEKQSGYFSPNTMYTHIC